jgi:hypothetical protein
MLNDDLLISPGSLFEFFENTAKVVPPRPGLSREMIAVQIGQPREGKVLFRELYADGGEVILADPAATRSITLPYGTQMAPGTDNQLVRLNDGSLLAEKDTYVWDDVNPKPVWATRDRAGRGRDGTLG